VNEAPHKNAVTPTLGVAFQGCACRAAFHAGVAQALCARGITPRWTAGASSGSIIAAAMAAGLGDRLPNLWRSFAGRSVVSLRRLWINRSPFDMSHLVRTGLRDHLGSGDLRAHPTEALVVATRLRGMRREIFSSHHEHDLVEPLLASCFLPLLYGRTIRLHNEIYVDGGITDNLPIEELQQRGAREVIAVVANQHGRLLKDLRRRHWTPALTNSSLLVIKPRRTLEIGSWDFDPERVERAIDAGHLAVRDALG
jgi:predicted acylesterase/phospholipase RssA